MPQVRLLRSGLPLRAIGGGPDRRRWRILQVVQPKYGEAYERGEL